MKVPLIRLTLVSWEGIVVIYSSKFDGVFKYLTVNILQ